ncbi:MAG: type II toxin-antitoxin system HigA family antitoxin [bacterium]
MSLKPETIENFKKVSRHIFVPMNENEYNQIVELLDAITDIVRDDEDHPLANVMNVLGVLVENYEQQHISEPDSDPVSILKHFMNEHNLRQKDLPELGGQSVVSEILNGKRQLNIRQIDALSKRFNVPKAVFV